VAWSSFIVEAKEVRVGVDVVRPRSRISIGASVDASSRADSNAYYYLGYHWVKNGHILCVCRRVHVSV
jgi:hypothetical protein